MTEFCMTHDEYANDQAQRIFNGVFEVYDIEVPYLLFFSVRVIRRRWHIPLSPVKETQLSPPQEAMASPSGVNPALNLQHINLDLPLELSSFLHPQTVSEPEILPGLYRI